ncbi:MAG: phosphoglucosamine mutase [bacterium]
MSRTKNKKISFGTDGIRGKADQFPFDQITLFHLGKAIAKWCIDKFKKESHQILIGHDTRESCSQIKQNLENGLLMFPIKILDAKVLPTPAIYQLIKQNKNLDCGIMISASHNPYFDNGIKIFNSKTGKLNKIDEEIILKNYNDFLNDELITKNQINSNVLSNRQSYEKYKKNIISLFPPRLLSGLTVILDCANGATYKIAPDIFKTLGANVIKIATNPNGKNINEKCGALHPQILQNTVIQNKADIGFAFDGDGDRVIAVNKKGQIKDGDDLLAILSQNPSYKKLNKIIGTVMTNKGFEEFLKKQNKTLIRTKVGDKYIASKLAEEKMKIGGETSGHIILKDYLNTGDGIFVALKTIQTIIDCKNWELKSFKKFPQVLINIPIKEKKDLNQSPISDIIENEKNKLINGRAIIRYSGTENLLRIMIEDTNKKSAKNIALKLSVKLKNVLN